MYNKKLLSKIDLGKYSKSDPYKKDIIYDPMGQWKYPGQPTRIPSSNITMKGVNFPVLAVTDNGQKKMMQPGQEYNFPGANYVDEFPQAKKGGSLKSKKYTRSLDGIGSLFVESALFQKPKNNKKRIFHPKAKYYQDGGEPCEQGFERDPVTGECVSIMGQTERVQRIEEVPINQYSPYIAAYEEAHPRDEFVYKKKADYLKRNKNWNRQAGLSQDNFNTDVEGNFNRNWEYDRNSAVIEQFAKDHGINPKNHVEIVEKMADKGNVSRDMIAHSKYGSKLQPTMWARSLAGAQELANFLVKASTSYIPGVLDKEAPDVFNKEIKGLTKKENKEIHKSRLGALESLAWMDHPGLIIGNALSGASLASGSGYGDKDKPGFFSGEFTSDMDPLKAALLNPALYADLGLGMVGPARAGLRAAPLLTKVDDVMDVVNIAKNADKVTDEVKLVANATPKSEINWAALNSKTVEQKDLMNAYAEIERGTKAKGNWMKNVDGTPFQGTPAQFVQQKSSWFKKSFPDYYGETLTTRSPNKFDIFDESKFGATDEGWYGKGIYTYPTQEAKQKGLGTMYGSNEYDLYVNSANKGFVDEPLEAAAEMYQKNTDQLFNDLKAYNEDYIKKYGSNELTERLVKESYDDLLQRIKAAEENNINQYTTLTVPSSANETVIPFSNRVKSAKGNIGYFDLKNPIIYEKNGGSISQTKYSGLHKFIEGGEPCPQGFQRDLVTGECVSIFPMGKVQKKEPVYNHPIKPKPLVPVKSSKEKEAAAQKLFDEADFSDTTLAINKALNAHGLTTNSFTTENGNTFPIFDSKGEYASPEAETWVNNRFNQRYVENQQKNNYNDGALEGVHPEILAMAPAGSLAAIPEGITNFGTSLLGQGLSTAIPLGEAVTAATAGSLTPFNILSSYFGADALVNQFPGAISDAGKGEYYDAADKALWGTLGVTGLGLGKQVFKPVYNSIKGLSKGLGYKGVPKELPGSPNAVDFSKYLTQEEAVAARGQRLISQKNKPGWNEQLTPDLETRLNNAVKNHNPASDYPGELLGTNTMGRTATEVSKDAISKQGIPLNDANKARVAGHETGHYYSNSPEEGAEWASHFDFSKLIHKTRTYLRGKGRLYNYSNEIRERAAQLKDYIAQKNGIPLNQDFKITQVQLDDAIKNYVKDTGLDNTMSKMLGALKNKKGFLKTMNKYALGTAPYVVPAAIIGSSQIPQNKYGGLNKHEEEGMILDLSPEEIEEYRKGGYIVEELDAYAEGGRSSSCPEGMVWSKKDKKCIKLLFNSNTLTNIKNRLNSTTGIPLTTLSDGLKIKPLNSFSDFGKEKPIPVREDSFIETLETDVNDFLGKPLVRAAQIADNLAEKGEDPSDPLRHSTAGALTAQTIANKTGNIPFISNPLGYLGSNIAGIGHELSTLYNTDLDDRPWSVKLQESLEDVYNNSVGASTIFNNNSEKDKINYLLNLTRTNQLPDGYGEERPFKNNPKWTDPYNKKQYGGALNNFAEGGASGCPRGFHWNGTKCVRDTNTFRQATRVFRGNQYFYKKPVKPVVIKQTSPPVEKEPIEEEIDLRLPPLKPGLLPQQNYELQGTYEEDQVPEYSPSYPENRIGYDKYNWNSGKQVGMGTKWTLPKRQSNTGGFNNKMSKKVEDIKNYMEGYEDEEGNYIPGEIEKAEQEGRQLQFKGNSSVADKKAQKNYNKEYDEYENLKNYQNGIMNLMQYKINKKQGGSISKYNINTEHDLTDAEVARLKKLGYKLEKL